MPQELHVLRCYSCQTFQVHIVKKSNKWECKMCGEKQSIKKVFGRGSGRDCRLHVQRLNEMRMEHEVNGGEEAPFQGDCSEDLTSVSSVPEENPRCNTGTSQFFTSHCSKWSRFLDELEEVESDGVSCSSVVSTSQFTTATLRNTHKTSTKENSEIKKETFTSSLLNSSEHDPAFYDASNEVFHTSFGTADIHQNRGACQRKRERSPESDEADEFWNRKHVGNPSTEVNQSCKRASVHRKNGLVLLPTINPVLANYNGVSSKSQKVVHSEATLKIDMNNYNEDELDDILRF